MTDARHECGLDRTHCELCTAELEVGQVGVCDTCRAKQAGPGEQHKWKTGGLPPDPENLNHERAQWADVALVAFNRATGAEGEENVHDLIADLHHWCDRAGHDFDKLLAHAQDCYAGETMEQG